MRLEEQLWIRRLFPLAAAAFAAHAAAQTPIATLTGESAYDRFGSAIAATGDLDGDGVGDFAVGAPGRAGAGAVYVFSGATHALLRRLDDFATGDFGGHSLANAGDVDGDGVNDLYVGAPRTRPWAPFDVHGAGYVALYSGASGLRIARHDGAASGDRFGWSLATGGDLDGDGVSELWSGAPGANAFSGELRVLSGLTGATLRVHNGNPALAERFGWSVARMPDQNGDGKTEYAAGAPAVGLAVAGWTRAFDGASGALLWERSGTNTNGDEFGWALARGGDFNLDGRADLLASGRRAGCDACEGRGYVLGLNGLTGATIFTKTGSFTMSPLGLSLVSLGDINADGREEWAASQTGADDFNGGSHFTLVASGNLGAAIAQIQPSGYLDSFGAALASFDANGDGLRDLCIGAPRDDDAGTDSGSVFVLTVVRTPVSYCTSQTNSLGCVPLVTGQGAASASSAAAFTITGAPLINQVSALLFYGFAPQSTPFLGGRLCVRPPLHRTAVANTGGSTGTVNCSGAFAIDFNDFIQSHVDPALVAGEEVYAQVWSRDAASASTTSLSNALGFQITP